MINLNEIVQQSLTDLQNKFNPAEEITKEQIIALIPRSTVEFSTNVLIKYHEALQRELKRQGIEI